MAQPEEYLPWRHKDVRLVPSTHITTHASRTHLQSQCMDQVVGGGEMSPWGSLAIKMSQFQWENLSQRNKMADRMRRADILLWHPQHTCNKCTCAHTHNVQTCNAIHAHTHTYITPHIYTHTRSHAVDILRQNRIKPTKKTYSWTRCSRWTLEQNHKTKEKKTQLVNISKPGTVCSSMANKYKYKWTHRGSWLTSRSLGTLKEMKTKHNI